MRFAQMMHEARLLHEGTLLGAAGHAGERLWLLGGLMLALGATGVVARAALRARRDR
ncbi:hypothetical protein [Streptomyces tritici]|uniref:hypothetical protein n=1 Tax=Streptomyces tritici TaxID=2054410 RepID=UPI003AF04430